MKMSKATPRVKKMMMKMMKMIQNVNGESGGKKRGHLPTRAGPPETWVVDASVGSTYSVGSGLAGTVGGSLSRRRSRSP